MIRMTMWPRIIIVLLLALIVGVPLVLKPDEPAAAAHAHVGNRLVIVSPHNEQIRYELSHAFNQWRATNGLPAVRFDWRSSGGTSDLRRMVLSVLESKARKGREDEGLGYDLFFGGGEYEHNKLAKGVKVDRGGKSVRITASVPIDLPGGLLERVFPEPMIGGEKLYHPQRYWLGAALSSFGIVYNRDVLKMRGLAAPGTWSDLVDGRYRNWVALADPGHSGSITATYDAILRRLGWKQGWWVLRRAFANSRYFTSGASKVPVDVSAGEAAAGMCIDFYGRYQAGAVHFGEGAERVGYGDPPYMTAITADPISILRGAPNHKVALQFVHWVLSPEAQSLWQTRLGARGGPQRFELRRLPVRRDMYTPARMADWVDRDVAPFDIAKPFLSGMPSFYLTIAPVAHAIAIDIHDDLKAAWDVVHGMDADDPDHRRALALFDAMPDDLHIPWPDDGSASNWSDILADVDHPRHDEVAATLKSFVDAILVRWREDKDTVHGDRLRWTLFFRENYRRIVKGARQ